MASAPASPSLARPRTRRAAAPVRARATGNALPGATLRNLGPASMRMLAAAGITRPAQLRRLGAAAAYVRVKRASSGASLNLLYALAGALDGTDWRAVKRTRRLELLTAVEDYERAHPAPASRRSPLLALRNIGPAMLRDLQLLGIRSVAQLARADADRLYLRLQARTGIRHDPCVWDTFAAAIHQARTGEALPWWRFTPTRKLRQAAGTFAPPAAGTARRRPAGASGGTRARPAGKRT